MTAFVALLRAVNVGKTGRLAMSELKRLGEQAGFAAVRTYIASGNLVFDDKRQEPEVKAALERALQAHAGKPVGVAVRSAAEMAAVLAANPFPNAAPNRTVAIFLSQAPSRDLLADVLGREGEELRLGAREIYVHYGEGMANSKLRIPGASDGTARNMRTVATLSEMAAGLT